MTKYRGQTKQKFYANRKFPASIGSLITELFKEANELQLFLNHHVTGYSKKKMLSYRDTRWHSVYFESLLFSFLLY